MDERRKDELSELRKAVTNGNKSLETLSESLMHFAINAEERTAGVEDIVNRYRRIGKYNRRTHFYTMASMVFGALFLADLSQHAHSVWWDLLFWAHPHGMGTTDVVLRVLGFTWQAAYLAFLVKIAQVPEAMWPDVTAAQIAREKQEKKAKRFRIS